MTCHEFLRGGEVVLARVERASSLPDRMRGLLGRRSLEADRGMWIVPCGSVHTFFMRFPIDVVFLDGAMRVTCVFAAVGPARVRNGGLRARSVLEAPPGWAASKCVRPGELLEARLRARP